MARSIRKAPSSGSGNQTAEAGPTRRLASALLWLALAAAWVLVALSLAGYHPADAPNPAFGVHPDPPANPVGRIGAVLAYEAYLMLGPGLWVPLMGVGLGLAMAACNRRPDHPVLRLAGLSIVGLCISAGWGLAFPYLVQRGWLGGEAVFLPRTGSGGLAAAALTAKLMSGLALGGTCVVLGGTAIAGLILAADRWVLAVPNALARGTAGLLRIEPGRWWITRALATTGRGLVAMTHAAAIWLQQRPVLAGWGEPAAPRSDRDSVGPARAGRSRSVYTDLDEVAERTMPAGSRARGRNHAALADAEPEDEFDDAATAADRDNGGPQRAEPVAVERGIDVEGDDVAEIAEVSDGPDAPDAYVGSKQFDPEALREKIARMPINFAPRGGGGEGLTAVAGAGIAELNPDSGEEDLSGYRFPGMELLEASEEATGEHREALVREQAQTLQSSLGQYGIDGEVVGIDSGPTITLYEVRLAEGTRVNRVQSIASDLARSLKAQNIRVVPNMVGKDTVGIEVPNLDRETVRLAELMSVNREKSSKMKLPMWLGKDASGHPLTYDLASMPHMLIAGTTGSGKSVCMNTIIMSFLFTRRPDELKLVLVDPKMVEMSMYKDIPHLMCPVVTEMSKAAAILEWAVTKMDERYELLAEAGVRDIAGFNALEREELRDRLGIESEEEWARTPKKLPYIVFVIDELADLMMTNKEVEGFIVRIAQKARAVGMHLILATQRPEAKVVTGLIKGNMPCRVSFRVASRLDSRIVLDQGGAELLLGHGDMMFLNPRTSKITRSQGTFVDDVEIRRVVKFLKGVSTQRFEPQLVQIRAASEGEEPGSDFEKDELFDAAVEVVLETQRGSVSLLQRKLTIGYARASRIIEQMEACGILGGHKTAQARQVLISAEEWEAMKAQALADAREAEGTVYAEAVRHQLPHRPEGSQHPETTARAQESTDAPASAAENEQEDTADEYEYEEVDEAQEPEASEEEEGDGDDEGEYEEEEEEEEEEEGEEVGDEEGGDEDDEYEELGEDEEWEYVEEDETAGR